MIEMNELPFIQYADGSDGPNQLINYCKVHNCGISHNS